jgi:hypothetical protein
MRKSGSVIAHGPSPGARLEDFPRRIQGVPVMNTVVERIGRYAAGLDFDDIGAPVADYARRILLDSLACACGGLDSEPARIVRACVKEDLGGGEQETEFGETANQRRLPRSPTVSPCATRTTTMLFRSGLDPRIK